MINATLDTHTVRRWRRYPEYRPSGAQWHREVPGHWNVRRLKFLAALNPSKSEVTRLPDDTEVSFLPMERVREDGSLSLELTRSLGEVRQGFTYFRDGDVLVAKITPCFENGKCALACGLVNGIGFGTTELHVLRPRPAIDGRYLELVTRLHAFREDGASQMYGAAGQQRVPEAFLSNYVAPLPPLPEQRAIAAFLDRETDRLDALIGHKERLIALLGEKRQAVISHAVTRGLDLSVPMKDSGLQWLGQIPAHWQVIPSKRVFGVRNEPAHDSDEQLTASQKYGMLLQKEFMEREGRRVVVTIKGTDSLRHVEPNDFVISLRSFQGGIEWSKLQGSVTFHYIVLKPVMEMHPAYFSYLLKSWAYIQALRATTDFIRDGQDLRYSHFALVPLPVVPMDEQIAIARFLDQQTSKLDALITVAQKTIDLLHEHRTALISAAVTGQIDVREEVAL